MDNPVTGLQIKQVAVRTGLSEQLIRKWEQRYRAVTPRRMRNGYRIYQEQDVRTLMAIAQLVERGVPVRRAVAVVAAERGEASDSGPDSRENVDVSSARAPENTTARSSDHGQTRRVNGIYPVVDEMLAAGAVGDVQRLETILQRCFVTEGLRVAVDCVLTPFLQEVGLLWSTGEWSEDQEHLSSLTVRNFLVRRMADLPDAPADAPVLLASCVPGERHDIMLQIALLQAKRLGWRTLFLGPDPAPGAIERALVRLHPDVLLLSITTRHEDLEGREAGCGDELDGVVDETDPDEGELRTRSAGRDVSLRVGAGKRSGSWFEQLSELAAQQPSTQVYLGGPAPLVHCCVDGLCHMFPLESLDDCLDVLSRRPLSATRVQ